MKKQSQQKIHILTVVIASILLALFVPAIFKTNLGNACLGLVVLSLYYCNKRISLFTGLIFIVFTIYMRFIVRKSFLEGYTQLPAETQQYLTLKDGRVVASKIMAANDGEVIPMDGVNTVPYIWSTATQNAITTFGVKKYPQSTDFLTFFTNRYSTSASDSEVNEYLISTPHLWPWTQNVTDKFKQTFADLNLDNSMTDTIINMSRMQLTNVNASVLAENINMYKVWVGYMIQTMAKPTTQ